MKSLKLNLVKRIKAADTLHLPDELIKQGLNIKDSILFRDIPVLPEEMYDQFELNFKHLPFNDFMLLCDTEHETPGGVVYSKYGLLNRIVKVNEDIVYQYSYYCANPPLADYILLTMAIIDSHSGEMLAAYSYRNGDQESLTLVNKLTMASKMALFTIINFEPKVISDPTRQFSVQKKVPILQRPKYIEYTLDITKAKKYTSKAIGGSHASPIEHDRRGHWRTYKNGKKVWVSSSVVNLGRGGRVDKDYSALGAMDDSLRQLKLNKLNPPTDIAKGDLSNFP